MTKSITKKAKTKGRKRPKSVLQKAWATRRANKAGIPIVVREMSKLQGERIKEQIASLAKGIPTSETATPRSEVDGIAAIIEVQRQELLCAFVAEMMERQTHTSFPITVSKPLADAIESYLLEQGFTPYGYLQPEPTTKAA